MTPRPGPPAGPLTLVAPPDAVPSGGNVYDARLAGAAGAELVHLDGGWPVGTPADRDRLAGLLHRLGAAGRTVVLDGLIGSGAPDQLAAAVAAGTRVWLLVHLPLPAEGGLALDRAAELAGLEARAVTAASGVLCPSGWAARDLAARYGVEARVVAPGVEAAPPARGSTPPRMLTLASLTPRKNHALVLTALLAVADLAWTAQWAGPIGDDPTTLGLGRRLAASSIAGRVDVPGPLRGAALERAWAASDLLLLPSHAETYAMVVTEAVARGVPAVVAPGAAAETLAGCATPAGLPGTVVPADDPDPLAAVLREWLGLGGLRAEWAERARAAAPRLAGWDASARALVAALAG